jgi:hypothetical protein
MAWELNLCAYLLILPNNFLPLLVGFYYFYASNFDPDLKLLYSSTN